jgi:hypothetical protein
VGGVEAEDGDGLGEDVEQGADAAGRRHPQVGRAAPARRVRACGIQEKPSAINRQIKKKGRVGRARARAYRG